MPKSTSETIYIDLPNSGRIPVRVIREPRRNARASVGKRHLILRRPRRSTSSQDRTAWEWFMDWARKMDTRNKGKQLAHLRQRYYTSGQQLQVGDYAYQLDIQEADRKTAAGRIIEQTIYLTLPRGLAAPQRDKTIKTLLSRCVAADFLPRITRRVHQLNQQHFKQPINDVRLKYNHSNWGSCSNKGNINLSTRLLFAPAEVIDYVIVHELAHRLEFNHSPRFWQIVAKAMPDYQQQEAWLKQHYDQCDF